MSRSGIKKVKMQNSDEMQRQITSYAADGEFDISTEYLTSTRRKFLIIFNTDVAAIG